LASRVPPGNATQQGADRTIWFADETLSRQVLVAKTVRIDGGINVWVVRSDGPRPHGMTRLELTSELGGRLGRQYDDLSQSTNLPSPTPDLLLE
jgi:hypothetical protein